MIDIPSYSISNGSNMKQCMCYAIDTYVPVDMMMLQSQKVNNLIKVILLLYNADILPVPLKCNFTIASAKLAS